MPLLGRAKWTAPWVCRSCRGLSTSTAKPVPERKAWQKLPNTPARTRFAPSPTGYLHLGSLRTALYNYLLARATEGQFILRVEDTDKKKRTVQNAEKRLYEDLKWAGLDWDEGPDNGGPYGPYKQSERTPLYVEHAQKLLQSGHAYRCFCSPERLNGLAKQRNLLGLSSDYDRSCASISKEESDDRASKGEAHVVRLKAPATSPDYFDLIYGSVGKSKSRKYPLKRGEPTYDDSILIKSDGLPTYHLANVVDDHHMKITHVIRASEWMTSTPKHLVMYSAFGWEPPQFAHVGLLQDTERQKFSKRNANLDIRTFEKDGIFPEALVNYVALHGWSHTLGNDFLSLQDLVQNFDLKFTKGNTMVQSAKLIYLQKKYAKKYIEESGSTFDSMVDQVYTLAKQNIQPKEPEMDLRNRIAAFMRSVPETYTTSKDFYNRHIALFQPVERPPVTPAADGHDQKFTLLPNHLSHLFQAFASLDENVPWTASEIKTLINKAVSDASLAGGLVPDHQNKGKDEREIVLEETGEKQGQKKYNAAVYHYLRWALTGVTSGVGVTEAMVFLGREETIRRMREVRRVLGFTE